MRTNVILFPNRRERVSDIIRLWWGRGYHVQTTLHGRMQLVIPRG
jgi:hypothetical protein